MDKNKVILINPSLSYYDEANTSVTYPLSALMIYGTMLNKAGYEFVFIDGNRYTTQETIIRTLRNIDESVIYVGFSVMTCQVPWTYEVVKAIKSYNKNIKIVLGGFHPSLYPQQTIGCEYIDVIAINEFTQMFMLLTEVLENGDDLQKVPSIIFRRGNRIIKTQLGEKDDIRKIPFIDFDLFDINYYKANNLLSSMVGLAQQNVSTGFILTGIGCAYKCNFCYNAILKRRYRFRKAEEIVDRIECLQKKYGLKYFQMMDEDFFINKKRVLEFIELIKERNITIYFRLWGRADHFNENYLDVALVKKLREVGMKNVVMGAESGVDRTLKSLNKGTTVADNENAIKILSNAGVIPRASFMVGLPEEEEEDILETFRFALRLKKKYKTFDPEILAFVPYPGSPLFDKAVKEYGLRTPQSFEEWASVDYPNKKHTGAMFFNAQDKPWIKDIVSFDRRLSYFYLFKQIESRIESQDRARFIYRLFKGIISIRFDLGFFYFPFELAVKNIVRSIMLRRCA